MEKTIYDGKEFNYYQISEIMLGEMQSLNTSIYAKPEFLHEQMREIRLGLEICYYGYELGTYAKKMVESYAKPEIHASQMREIRIKIEKIENICCEYGLYYDNQLKYFRISDKKVKGGWSAQNEILQGLEKNLDVSIYAKPEFNAQQMCQIKQGLKKGLDVSIYAKPEIPASQMREIRLSLLQSKQC